MPDLIIRPSGLPADKNKPWVLQLRYHDSCGPTEYETLCYMTNDVAREVIKAGEPYWLYGDPDMKKESDLADYKVCYDEHINKTENLRDQSQMTVELPKHIQDRINKDIEEIAAKYGLTKQEVLNNMQNLLKGIYK